MTTPGRREQHKAATRLALQTAAAQMFEQNGYDRTTVRDIAAAAGVTERTFFRYFASKEELVLGEVLDLIPVVQQRVRERPAGEPPYTAVERSILGLLDEREVGYGILFAGSAESKQADDGMPTPTALLVLHDFEDGIATALATRPGVAAGLPAAVLARAAVGAIHSTIEAYSNLPDTEKTIKSACHLIEEAFAVLASYPAPIKR
jgi:AcrR family transcriptional regulator